jgi:outer membrane protein assembly factor BamB
MEMRKITANILFWGTLLSCSCTKEDNSISTSKDAKGVITEKQYLWWNKEEEHDQSIITTPLIFNGGFIAETHQNGRSYMSLQNAKDGKVIWKWDDYHNQEDIALRHPYYCNKFLYFQSGPRTYSINMESGETRWYISHKNSFQTSIWCDLEDLYLSELSSNDGASYPGVIVCNQTDGTIKYKIIPKFTNTSIKNVLNEFGTINGVRSTIINGKKYLLISYTEAIDIHSNYQFISLYNLAEKRWEYEYKNLGKDDILGDPIIYKNRIYHYLGYHILCNDLVTGDKVWDLKFSGTFGFGEYIIDNGTLYAAAEGDGYYALDAETGAIKWKGERAPGTSSRMVVLNGVLYYINGGDGRLWALDAVTGKTLWRLKSPDGYSFKREINVMQGDGERKGYVLTSTWHGACAYEAER